LTSRDVAPQDVLVEACVDSVASAVAAERGGARRIELCAALADGGTTPSAGVIAACKAAVAIPVFVIVRPRGGGFMYSDLEREVMRRDVIAARELGVDGIVTGGLHREGTIDLELVQTMIDAARGLPLTFHRAFDFTRSLDEALETLATSGVQRVLSSGRAATAIGGAAALASLVRQARGRIVVMAGGGVREENVMELVTTTGVREVHVRLTRLTHDATAHPVALRIRKPFPDDETAWEETDEERMRRFVALAAGRAGSSDAT
jgi:copper homeostasis protein